MIPRIGWMEWKFWPMCLFQDLEYLDSENHYFNSRVRDKLTT